DRIDRLNKIIDYLGITKHSLATSSGIAPSNFTKMMAGESNITDKTLLKISEAFPQINVEWLRTGQGEMLSARINVEGHGNVIQDGHASHNLTQTNNSEKILSDFIEGIKSQNLLTERAMSQTDSAMNQTDRAMAQTDKALNEISEQRKLVDRLITIIESR
ncbi:MAG: helix-turn-helix transcriptional regulator, partial [Muribaculaceae bacterium]|nr:helix-turn-helix transcriptional regulator [Muribaculaceae bacterium]